MPKLIFIFMISLVLSVDVFAADQLTGRILAVDELGVEKPIDNIGIRIGNNEKNPQKSINNGMFELSTSGKDAGDKMVITIDRPGWSILSPYNGEFYLPKDLENEKLIVRIVPFPLNFYPSAYFDSKIMGGNAKGTHMVQVFVTTDRMKAANLVNSIKNQKLEARYETILGTPVQYRVLVGPFQSKLIADETRVRIIKDFDLSDKPFVKPRF